MSSNLLQTPLDAGAQEVMNLGTPTADGSATFADRTSTPSGVAVTASAGSSLKAAPADHAHSLAASTIDSALGPTSTSELQRKFYLLLKSWVTIGLPVPVGLEDDTAVALGM